MLYIWNTTVLRVKPKQLNQVALGVPSKISVIWFSKYLEIYIQIILITNSAEETQL